MVRQVSFLEAAKIFGGLKSTHSTWLVCLERTASSREAAQLTDGSCGHQKQYNSTYNHKSELILPCRIALRPSFASVQPIGEGSQTLLCLHYITTGRTATRMSNDISPLMKIFGWMCQETAISSVIDCCYHFHLTLWLVRPCSIQLPKPNPRHMTPITIFITQGRG